MSAAAPSSRPLRLQALRAAQDQELYAEFDEHLAPLRQYRGLVVLEPSPRLDPGNDVDIIVLFVTRSLFAHHQREIEQTLVRRSNARIEVVPLIISPTAWELTPLQDLNALPLAGYPVTCWPSRDLAWYNVVRGIDRLMEELRGQPPQVGPGEQGQAPSVPWRMQLPVSLQDFRVDLSRLLGLLQGLSEDGSYLVLERVLEGVRLELRGSMSGFLRIAEQVRVGGLRELLGFPVSQVELRAGWMTLRDLADYVAGWSLQERGERLRLVELGLGRRAVSLVKRLIRGELVLPPVEQEAAWGLGAGPTVGASWQCGVTMPEGTCFERALILRGASPARVLALRVRSLRPGRFLLQLCWDAVVPPGVRWPWTLQAEGPPGENLLLFYRCEDLEVPPRWAELLRAHDVADQALVAALQASGTARALWYQVLPDP